MVNVPPIGQVTKDLGVQAGKFLFGVPSQVAVTPGGAAALTPPEKGLLGHLGMSEQARLGAQLQFQDPRFSQLVGSGVIGAGMLGTTAAASAFGKAVRGGKEKSRFAGQQLGSQLGVGMPILY
jgi:succinate dehydrogenase/fumarate reductase flavoprotein subunit